MMRMTGPVAVTRGSSSATARESGGVRVSDLAFGPDVVLEEHAHPRACLAVVLDGGVDKRLGRMEARVVRAGGLTMPAGAAHCDRFEPAGARLLVVEPDAQLAARLGDVCRAVLDRVNSYA